MQKCFKKICMCRVTLSKCGCRVKMKKKSMLVRRTYINCSGVIMQFIHTDDVEVYIVDRCMWDQSPTVRGLKKLAMSYEDCYPGIAPLCSLLVRPSSQNYMFLIPYHFPSDRHRCFFFPFLTFAAVDNSVRQFTLDKRATQ